MGRLARMALDRALEPDHPQLPVILHIETTSRCNLRCPTCAHAEKGGVGEDLSLDQFKTLVDQFDYVAKTILYGIGEPLLHRDLFEMVRHAKGRGIFCGFFTNGVLLTERIREEVLENGQDYLNISIDGATRETFEKQRAGAVFEKVVSNVKALTALVRERRSALDVEAWNCLTAENVHELPQMVRLTAGMGVRKLVTQDIMFWNSPGIEDAFRPKQVDIVDTRREKALEEATREARRLGIGLDLLMSAGDRKRTCQIPWYFAYVTAKGLATPCNWLGWDGSKLNFGNVADRPFKEIWNGPEYVKFRREMKGSEEPEFCRKCPMWDRKIVRLVSE